MKRGLKGIYLFFVEMTASILLYQTIKLYLSNHLTIGIYKLYKAKTRFPHPVGIVIGMKVKMGVNCEIYQNVTIGTKDTSDFLNGKYPEIGNNVTIYPNSLVIGDIKIGDNSIIGAGSVILKNVPPNSVMAGNPAKLIKHRT